MAKNSSDDQGGRGPSSQLNVRLPLLSHDQINALAENYGLTKTQVIILAVDRFARDLETQSAEAEKDVRMLKTVARINPQIDLGQDG
jgi:predicted DNA-binding protein